MKQCPMRALAYNIAPANVHIAPEYQYCISDKCAWWVDDVKIQPVTVSLSDIGSTAFINVSQDHVIEAHHCGLIGRVWGRDDREG